MIEILVSLGGGLAVGAFFSVIGAAVPAPPTIAGVAGILGITLGYILVTAIKG